MTSTISTYERYRRQTILKDFGTEAQDKLSRASVLVVGAGGLGCPCLQYLVAAGTGKIGIVDFDTVTLDNLHRQILFGTADIGNSKALAATHRLHALNPDIRIDTHHCLLTENNIDELLQEYDIIVDASDNFETRYTVSDSCSRLDKILVFGAVSTHEGQVAVFNKSDRSGRDPVRYRDVFPIPPQAHEIPNCAEAGVLGVLTGIIGSIMANEVIKIITGYGDNLSNQLLTYDSKSNKTYLLDLSDLRTKIDNVSKIESDVQEQAYDDMTSLHQNIDTDFLFQLINNASADIVDIRGSEETPAVTAFPCLRIPMQELDHQMNILSAKNLVLICQSGQRSAILARELAKKYSSQKRIYSLKGGVNQLLRNKFQNHHEEGA
jgi:adenylyltransferase/sulfurtransferase